MTQQIKNPKKKNRKKLKKRKSWKIRTRGNCEAEASLKKNHNSDDPSGSIRDITAHLIHD